MSAALEQSLDAIISSTKKAAPRRAAGKKKAAATKVAKAPAKKQQKKPVKAAKPAAAPALDLASADKVIVYGLPKDIKQDALRSQVGGVKSVSLAYNSKGLSTGVATVIFKKAASASKAVTKFNGASIDNGKSKLRLELVVDPSRKPLASRIIPNDVAAAVSKKAKATKPKAKPVAKGAAAGSAKKQPAKSKTASKPKKTARERKPKKTIEELDQEMADYFATSEAK